MQTDEQALRAQMVQFSQLLFSKNLIAAADGNLSVKLDAKRLLMTPSGMCKGLLRPQDLLIVDRVTGQSEDQRRPTSEILMHLKAYEQRPDIGCVVHAHPPFVLATNLAGIDLNEILPETIISFRQVRSIAYATPTTSEVPELMQDSLLGCDQLILARHGTVTVAPTLTEAYIKLEALEHNAKIITYATLLQGKSGPAKLAPEQLAKIYSCLR